MENTRKIAYSKRRTWSRMETRTLLVFSISRKDEFTHIFKRKSVYRSLLEDLTSSAVSDIPFTEDEIKNKIKSLKRAYKDALDNVSKTGAGYSMEPYKDLLKELFDKERPTEMSEFQIIATGVAGRATPIPAKTKSNKRISSNSSSPLILDSDDLIEISLPDNTDEPRQPAKKTRTPKKSIVARKLEFLKEREAAKNIREKNCQKRHQNILKIHEDQKEIHEERRKWHQELVDILKNK